MDEGLPDLLALLFIELTVVQLHVYARGKGVVESANAVGGQEEDAVVVLESAEEGYAVYVRFFAVEMWARIIYDYR